MDCWTHLRPNCMWGPHGHGLATLFAWTVPVSPTFEGGRRAGGFTRACVKNGAQISRCCVGSSTICSNARSPLAGVDDRARDAHFILTNGTHRYTAIEIPTGHKDDGTPRAPLLLFVNELPPPRAELWVVARHTPSRSFNRVSDLADAVICFTNGTLIDTPTGPVPVEHLGKGIWCKPKTTARNLLCGVGAVYFGGADVCYAPSAAGQDMHAWYVR